MYPPNTVLFKSVLAIFAVTTFVTAQEPDFSASPLIGEGMGDTYIEPYRSIELSVIETGYVDEIYVKEGQKVEKNEELIKLDSDLIEAQLAIVQAQSKNEGRIMGAQAEFDQQEDRYSRLKKLGRTTSEAELTREFAILKAYEGALLTAKEEIKVFELEAKRIEQELARRIIKSPINGRVITITKDVGESVNSRSESGSGQGEAAKEYLVRIVQLTRLKATSFLPYQSIAGLKEGDKLDVEVYGLNEVVKVQSEVEYIAPLINPSTSTVAVRVVIENADEKLTSGSPAKVLLPKISAAVIK